MCVNVYEPISFMKHFIVLVVHVVVVVTRLIYYGFVGICVFISNIVYFTVKSPFNDERR